MDRFSKISAWIGLMALAFVAGRNGYAQEPGIRPRPPRIFAVTNTPEGILLEWTTHPGEPDPESWEIYRTDQYVDNLPYHRIETLPGSARSLFDVDIIPDTGYFYYIVAIGKPTPIDPSGLAGTPDGSPFRSNRYFTQTNDLVAVGVRSGLDADTLFQNMPNPFTDRTSIRYVANGPAFVQIKVFNILGQEVALLLDDFVDVFATGQVAWTGVDHAGKKVSSGIYYCQIFLSLPVGTVYRQAIPMALIR